MTDSFHSANAETKSVQGRTPLVLNTIRIAADDCRVQGNTVAAHELLDAAAMVSGLLKTMDIVADGLSAGGRTMDGMTKAVAAAKLHAAIAKATGSTT